MRYMDERASIKEKITACLNCSFEYGSIGCIDCPYYDFEKDLGFSEPSWETDYVE